MDRFFEKNHDSPDDDDDEIEWKLDKEAVEMDFKSSMRLNNIKLMNLAIKLSQKNDIFWIFKSNETKLKIIKKNFNYLTKIIELHDE